MLYLRFIFLTILILSNNTSNAEDEVEFTPPTSSSSEFLSSVDKVTDKLKQEKFDDLLSSIDPPSLGATENTNGEQQKLISEIKNTTDLVVSTGSQQIQYDVILQPGHYGRKFGAVGTSGVHVSEQQLSAYLVKNISDKLKSNGVNVLVVPADNVVDGLKAKIFLAVHEDGSAYPCTTGPSLAYERNDSMYAMHTIGYALAKSYGYKYADFRKDNFTVNESKYYMFRKLNTSIAKGLLEVGELTCQLSENNMIYSANTISANIAAALKFLIATEM